MNNFILINRTFAETTPESAEQGDFSKRGFITKREQVSFTELVEMMSEHTEPSSSPDDYSIHTWYSTGFYTSDYRTCTEREECIHFHKNNTANAAKYWKWARIYADNKRKQRQQNIHI